MKILCKPASQNHLSQGEHCFVSQLSLLSSDNQGFPTIYCIFCDKEPKQCLRREQNTSEQEMRRKRFVLTHLNLSGHLSLSVLLHMCLAHRGKGPSVNVKTNQNIPHLKSAI